MDLFEFSLSNDTIFKVLQIIQGDIECCGRNVIDSFAEIQFHQFFSSLLLGPVGGYELN